MALVAAVAINAALAWQGGEAIESLERWEFELVRHARILEGEAPELLSDGRGYLLTQDPRFLDDFAEDRQDARAALARLRELVRTAEGRTLVETIDAHLENTVAGVEHRIALAQQGRTDLAVGDLVGARAVQAELFTLLDALVEREESLLRARMDDIQRERLVGLATGAVLLALVGVFAIGLLLRGRSALEAAWARQRAAAIETEVLRRSDRLKSALLSSVSHDLRTPLASIKTSVSGLLNERVTRDDDARRDLLLAIDEEADRLARFVSRLLDLSRVEAGVAHPELAPHAVEDLLAPAADRLDADRQRIRLTLDDVPTVVSVDNVMVEQIVANLLENAVKYSPPDAPVELAARARDGELTIAVADRGPGVPPAERERIFEKFYQAQARAGGAIGSGIGLAIARGLARAHGGDVRYEPRAGGGSVFCLRLPLVGDRSETAVA